MMKIVISFDEIGLDNGFSDFDPVIVQEKLIGFLFDQFPEWDNAKAFEFPPEYDFDNMEIHLLMPVIP